MGLTIERLQPKSGAFVTAKQRLCRTEDGRLVSEDEQDARWLFCIPGQSIAIIEARKFGLIEDPVPVSAVATDPSPVVPVNDDQGSKESKPARTKVVTKKEKKTAA